MGVTDRSDGQLDRRRIVQAAALGVAATTSWAAPSVLTIDQALAVGSTCGASQSFDWTTGTPATGSTDFTNTAVGSSSGGVAVTATFVGGGGISQRGTNLSTLGGTSNLFEIDKNGAANNAAATLTLTFSATVFSLDLTLLDIDADNTLGSHYRDRVAVDARSAANVAVSPTTTQLGVPVGGGAVSGPSVSGAYPTFTGTGTAADTGTAGNVRLVWPSTGPGVKSITFTYTSLIPTAGCVGFIPTPPFFGPVPCTTSTAQYVGISRLTFC